MSDPQDGSHSSEAASADSSTIREEVQREYAAKLATAELKAHAAEAGLKLPDGYTDYLDASKLLGDDGQPSAEAISSALAPLRPKEPQFPQLAGTGHNRNRYEPESIRRVSLDVRKR
jgi:hypothetical protein